MDYDKLNELYEAYLNEKASALNMSVHDYLLMLVNNSQLFLHTMEVTALIKGYLENGELNLKLSEEGLLDTNGDIAW